MNRLVCTREQRIAALDDMVNMTRELAEQPESEVVHRLIRMVGVLCAIVREGLEEATPPSSGGSEK